MQCPRQRKLREPVLHRAKKEDVNQVDNILTIHFKIPFSIMILVIAEKPSVAREIARVLGATEKQDGYISGNGYCVG